MLMYDKKSDEKLISFLLRVKEKPGACLGEPSLDRLLLNLACYSFAMHDLTGHRPQLEPMFRTHLQKKYGMDHASVYEILIRHRSEEEAFFAFFDELELFLHKTT